MILKTNDYYYKDKSDISTLTFKKVDEKSYINNLISGNIDIAYDILPNNENIEEASNAQFLNGYMFDTYDYGSIGINHSNELLKDISIRKAINVCIDKNQIVKNISDKNFNIIDAPIDGAFQKFL